MQIVLFAPSCLLGLLGSTLAVCSSPVPVAPAAYEAGCCCFPAHSLPVESGTCASCSASTPNCGGGFNGTVFPSACFNYRETANCVLGGTVTVSVPHYQCSGSPLPCGTGLSECAFAEDSATLHSFTGCGTSTDCPPGATVTTCN